MDTWPRAVLTPQRGGRPNYAARTVSGGVTSSGFVQTVASNTGVWKLTLGDIAIRGWRQLQVWDTIALRLEGRLNPILIPLSEGWKRQPFVSQPVWPEGVPHSDDSFFDDDTGYLAAGVVASIAANAALRATTVQILAEHASELQPAHFFSLHDGRLYQIRNVDAVDGNLFTVRIRPGLRIAAVDGDKAEFAEPKLRAKLAKDDGMDRDLLLNRIGELSVDFIEDASTDPA